MALDLTPAVDAAAERLNTCDFVFWCEQTGEDNGPSYEDAVNQLASAYCGCNYCNAREAIHASVEIILRDFLKELSIESENPDQAPCCIVGKRAWDYHVALLDISLGNPDPKDRALKALGMKKEKP